MISGATSESTNLSGRITPEGSLTGTVTMSVRDVPYYETDNLSGGITVYIAKEVEKQWDTAK